MDSNIILVVMRVKLLVSLIWVLLLTCSLRATESDGNFSSNIIQDDSSMMALQNAIQQIDKIYTSKHHAGAFNGNILIAKKGVPVYKKSFGYANKATGERLTIESTFQLASTSKPFTAAAILILIERGKIGLDDMVQKYYPQFPYYGVTVRHLLCHRSGLPDYLNFAKLYSKSTYIDNQDLVDMMIARKPKALAKPNIVFKYNNTNYALLAALVEKVSGQSFATFCEENIFEPLGMYNTWVWHPTQAHRKGQTYGYSASWVPRKPDLFDGVAGDKGVYSTVEDLLKWDQSWYNQTLLKSSTIQMAYEGQTKSPSGKDYGLGWRTNTSGNQKMIYHNGWWHNYNIVFKRFINDSTTIIIFSNRYNQSIYNTTALEALLFKNKPTFDESDSEEPLMADAGVDNSRNATIIDALATHNPPYTLPIAPQPFTSPVIINAPVTVSQQPSLRDADNMPTIMYYIVKKGDTLFNISKKFYVSVELLKKWNKLSNVDIKLGQQLMIRK